MTEINIKNIIEERNIISLFQPVVSLKEKRVIGFEALSRGICSETGRIIKPTDLFNQARAENSTVELDRLCRYTALKSFKNIPGFDKFILFLNLDTSVLDMTTDDAKRVTKQYTDDVGLDYSSISIEIVESKIENTDKLAEFIDHYRKLGFYVSLDDFGAMHSNMNRIAISKPDIIKIDMELINNVSVNYYQQSILSSIINLAKKTGALTLAEGLENFEDIIKCYELGIDLYQGFYFYKPCVDVKGNSPFIQAKIEYLVHNIKNRLRENVMIRKNQHSGFDFIINYLKNETEPRTFEEYIRFLKSQTSCYSEIERVFILDENGQQSYESINNISAYKRSKSFSMLHENNSDHSLRDYFYFLDKIDSDRFYTDTFMSPMTGRILRTMSCKIEISGKNYVLCVDFIDNSYNNCMNLLKGA
jgi:EAL domain-containing protein (putative c-di-GMP-specific phosphodiesterase class I)